MLQPSNYTTLPFALATFCPACVVIIQPCFGKIRVALSKAKDDNENDNGSDFLHSNDKPALCLQGTGGKE